jgi:hypothetical protein
MAIIIFKEIYKKFTTFESCLHIALINVFKLSEKGNFIYREK